MEMQAILGGLANQFEDVYGYRKRLGRLKALPVYSILVPVPDVEAAM